MSLSPDVGWPIERLGEAMEATARRARLGPRAVDRPTNPGLDASGTRLAPGSVALSRWALDTAAWLGIDVEPIEATYAEARALVTRAAPALLCVRDRAGPRYLAVLAVDARRVTLLSPREEVVRAGVDDVARALLAPIEEAAAPAVDALLARAAVPADRRDAARRALFAARLGAHRLDGSYLLDLPASAGFLRHARRAGLPRRLTTLLAAHAASYLLFLASWTVVGRGALGGRIDRGWLVAWALLLLTQVPLRALVTSAGGRLALDAGALVKRRLLTGALELDADAARSSGVGQLFGRVIEAEAFEALALGGGIAGLVAALELAFAAVVLGLGAAKVAHVLALVAWIGVAALLARRSYRARAAWTEARLDMTHDLVERMVGHRTRLAQQAPARWHEGEDQALARYLDGSLPMDRLAVLLSALLPRGFLLIALALLAPAFVAGSAGAGPLAVSLGGALLAQRAFARLSAGLADLTGAAIAWRTIGPLFAAAARTPAPPHPEATASPAGDDVVIDAHDLTFYRPGRAAPVLSGVTLRVHRGDRILLQGASGAGKSTLAAILSGLREPTSGLLLVGGLDRHTLGARGFCRQVAAAPQFHDNHVISGPFALNLLMGRAWPPRREDLALAEKVCRELDLGPLLDRMPGGLFQMVGDTGWQLSHGERSRLYIARALLQDANLVVLDESFGALDPETLEDAMACVLRRAESVLVIAHP